jgi:capreomycidine synthase
MRLPPAPLEDWLRDYYFATDADISSSGVEPYSFKEIRQTLGIDHAELDSLEFRDSRSCGDPRLREAIARRWGDGDPDRVMAGNGSTEVLFLVMAALLRPGDEVVVVEPAYHALVSIATGIGCRIVSWPLRFEHSFAPDFDELGQLLSGRTRMLVVNFPHNPTGVSIDRAAQERLVAMAAERAAFLVWDGAFADLALRSPALPDASLLYDKAISFGTLSKSFGLPGLRVGWCFAPPDVLRACVQWRDYTTLALSPLVELVAIRAVEHAEALLGPRLAQAQRNLALLEQWVARQEGDVSWVSPDGGVVAFPRLNNVPDVEEFCHRLMDSHRVLLVPGTCFGRPGHVRLGFGGGARDLALGLDAVGTLLRIPGGNGAG